VQNISGAVDANEVGIPDELRPEWEALLNESFAHYNKAIQVWTEFQNAHPEATNLPANASPKLKERLTKNFALDRSRYYLFFGLKTNIAMVASARIWVEAVRHLSSMPQLEAQLLACQVRDHLQLFAPRLTKHSTPESSYQAQAANDLSLSLADLQRGIGITTVQDECEVQVSHPSATFFPDTLPTSYQFLGKQNRYSRVGSYYRRMVVRFAWNNIAVAEMRDLNRHRTGHRMSLLSQRGLYLGPTEGARVRFHHDLQCATTAQLRQEALGFLERQAAFLAKLAKGNSSAYVYSLLLGSQSPFEHVTGADKFMYEAELRTGMGSHYRYAEHLATAVAEFNRICPEAAPYINLGVAEPE
jgi:hypothetical protein